MKKREYAKQLAIHDVSEMPPSQITEIARKEKRTNLILAVLIAICTLVLIACIIVAVIAGEIALMVPALVCFFPGVAVFLVLVYQLKNRDDRTWAIEKIQSKYINKPALLGSDFDNPVLLNNDIPGPEQTKLKSRGFIISKVFACGSKYITTKLYIDNTNKHFTIHTAHSSGDQGFSKIYNFSDIISYEVYENERKIVQGTTGEALLGGLFFGIQGAIIGSSVQKDISDICTQLELLIRVNDFNTPQIKLTFIKNSTCEKNSAPYRAAKAKLQEICAQLEYITNNKTLEQSATSQHESSTSKKSSKEQLQELKEMLDDGLITQEDYEQKKKQILGL